MVWKYDYFEKKKFDYIIILYVEKIYLRKKYIYIIWFIWRYFLLFYESLRDLNYFSSLLISFWICNYYWKEKYIYKIVIIKSSVDL